MRGRWNLAVRARRKIFPRIILARPMSPICDIRVGHVLTELRKIPDGYFRCCVTSPPYFGLRSYGTEPQIWGGRADCVHDWSSNGQSREHPDRSTGGKDANGSGIFITERGEQPSKIARGAARSNGSTCSTCGAWRGELGSEPTLDMFIQHIVEIFREVRRTLADDGSLWVNFGDSYAGSWGAQSRGEDYPGNLEGGSMLSARQIKAHPKGQTHTGSRKNTPGLKNKDLMMVPARIALALQADGWYLRSMIPWVKRNCMPESVSDRPTSATEYVFLLSKSESYFYNKEPTMIVASKNSHARLAQNVEAQNGTERANGGRKTNGNLRAVCGKISTSGSGIKNNESMDAALSQVVLARNRRNSDWLIESWQGLLADSNGDPLAFVVNPQPYTEAHFATWPPKLVQPMILASTEPGDWVLDPFFGSGTSGEVALGLGRNCVGLELNPAYAELAKARTHVTGGLAL